MQYSQPCCIYLLHLDSHPSSLSMTYTCVQPPMAGPHCYAHHLLYIFCRAACCATTHRRLLRRALYYYCIAIPTSSLQQRAACMRTWRVRVAGTLSDVLTGARGAYQHSRLRSATPASARRATTVAHAPFVYSYGAARRQRCARAPRWQNLLRIWRASGARCAAPRSSALSYVARRVAWRGARRQRNAAAALCRRAIGGVTYSAHRAAQQQYL